MQNPFPPPSPSLASPQSRPAPLRIVCPPQRRPLALVLAVLSCGVIAPGIWRVLSGQVERSYLYLWIAGLMAVGSATLVYRNLAVRDTLWLAWDGQGGAPLAEDVLVLDAGRVRAVRLLPAPGPYSSEGKMATLGLAPGRIEIEADGMVYRFGAGLGRHRLEETVMRIERYCGLRP